MVNVGGLTIEDDDNNGDKEDGCANADALNTTRIVVKSESIIIRLEIANKTNMSIGPLLTPYEFVSIIRNYYTSTKFKWFLFHHADISSGVFINQKNLL
jgi:hypothetical protein